MDRAVSASQLDGSGQPPPDLAKRPVPDELLRDWFAPFIRDQRVRQDLRSYCLSVPLDSGRNWSAGLVLGPAVPVPAVGAER